MTEQWPPRPASVTLAAARARAGRHAAPFTAPVAKHLTDQERAEALDIFTNGGACRCCGGLHAGDEMACPRLASFELDGDGKIRAGTYFRDGEYDASSIIRAADAAEEGDGDA